MSATPALTHTATTWLPLLRETLAAEGSFRFPLRGASMRPTLPPACEVEIVPLPPQVALGSLLVFVSGDTLIVHRLVRRAAAGWIAHGDGRLGPDRPLLPGQALGVVAAAYRNGRRIWPGRVEPLLRWFWIARHHALRPARFAWRMARPILARGRSSAVQ